jgi:hypothetical protein
LSPSLAATLSALLLGLLDNGQSLLLDVGINIDDGTFGVAIAAADRYGYIILGTLLSLMKDFKKVKSSTSSASNPQVASNREFIEEI